MMMLAALSLVALFGLSQTEIAVLTENTAIFLPKGERLQDIMSPLGYQTPPLNCDTNRGIGDFETKYRCEKLEVKEGKCLIPCENPVAMECTADLLKTNPALTATYVYTTCLNLTDKDTDPADGFYCKDASSRPENGGACNDPGVQGNMCHLVLGAKCDCPDSKCSWYCPQPQAERDAYCAARMKKIQQTRTLVIKSLKGLFNQRMVSKRGLFAKNKLIRKSLGELVRKELSLELFEKAIEHEKDADLVMMSEMLLDDRIDWEN